MFTQISKKVFITLTLGLMVFSLAACSLNFSKNGDQNAVEDRMASNPALERQYEDAVKEIIKPVLAGGSTTGIKDKILALRTPAKYLNLQLSLVLAFDILEQGEKQAAADLVKQGKQKLDQLTKDYPWLK